MIQALIFDVDLVDERSVKTALLLGFVGADPECQDLCVTDSSLDRDAST
ncbi:MAG: hypothetical protein ACI841_000990 [Planctomycetota bacterium]|jgi:hypothetical protein